MRYVDEFRDAGLGRVLAGEILGAVEPGRHYKLMEVCGGHTHSIYKTASTTCCPPTSSSSTDRAVRCASSRWAASTTASPWPTSRA